MQNTQEINWLLEIVKIAVPSLITLAIGLWLSRKTESYKSDLSKEIEDYKKGISKELEIHKIQLQSDFQTNLYEFQTRFSLLHQKRAEVFAEIISMAFLLGKKIVTLEYERKEVENVMQSYEEFESYYFKNRIYVNKALKENIDEVINEFGGITLKILKFLSVKNELNKSAEENKLAEENTKFENEISTSLNKIVITLEFLEGKFIETLFPEPPDSKLSDKSK